MYSILIVDDERTERLGIELLIKKYGYDLEVIQASNGEQALEILKEREIDILLTDIKMPFITGIELIRQVRQLGYDSICVIYSAYGEFEYAKDAISLGVLQYLLKPINLDEFQKLFEKIFESLNDKKTRIQQNKQLEIELENITNISHANYIISWLDNEYSKKPEFLKENITYLPIIISSYSNIFSKYWDNYQSDLYNIFGSDCSIINKNDTQIILFLNNCEFDSNQLLSKCEEIIVLSEQQYKSELFIVIGLNCVGLDNLKKEYNKMYEQLDYQFFISKSIAFVCDEDGCIKRKSDILPLHFEKMLTFASIYNFDGLLSELEKAFIYVEKNIGFSSVYIKYNFSKAMQRCCEILNCQEKIMQVLEKIYDSSSLSELKNAVVEFVNGLSDIQLNKSNEENRIVSMAKKIIKDEYANYSLNVSYIAQKLGISSAYMSTLFKSQTKQNMAKYISEYRMDKAKQLLASTNLKISEVGEKVGYLNNSYFVSLFKNAVGCSPAKYREATYEQK